MTKIQNGRVMNGVVLLLCAVGMACQLGLSQTGSQQQQGAAQSAATAPQPTTGLILQNEAELPVGHPHRPYDFHFLARGGVAVLHWKVEKGKLPPGLKLEDNGLLHGAPQRSGEFQFTISVTDGGNSRTAVQKNFILRVLSALTVNWKAPARVNGKRIEGSVEVSNTSLDDMDLTYVVVAIASNGRATAIGYQHFALHRDTVGMELPFGETLPPGGYVVRVDVVGEVAARKLIHRANLQTPGPLQVTVGP